MAQQRAAVPAAFVIRNARECAGMGIILMRVSARWGSWTSGVFQRLMAGDGSRRLGDRRRRQRRLECAVCCSRPCSRIPTWTWRWSKGVAATPPRAAVRGAEQRDLGRHRVADRPGTTAQPACAMIRCPLRALATTATYPRPPRPLPERAQSPTVCRALRHSGSCDARSMVLCSWVGTVS